MSTRNVSFAPAPAGGPATRGERSCEGEGASGSVASSAPRRAGRSPGAPPSCALSRNPGPLPRPSPDPRRLAPRPSAPGAARGSRSGRRLPPAPPAARTARSRASTSCTSGQRTKPLMRAVVSSPALPAKAACDSWQTTVNRTPGRPRLRGRSAACSPARREPRRRRNVPCRPGSRSLAGRSTLGIRSRVSGAYFRSRVAKLRAMPPLSDAHGRRVRPFKDRGPRRRRPPLDAPCGAAATTSVCSFLLSKDRGEQPRDRTPRRAFVMEIGAPDRPAPSALPNSKATTAPLLVDLVDALVFGRRSSTRTTRTSTSAGRLLPRIIEACQRAAGARHRPRQRLAHRAPSGTPATRPQLGSALRGDANSLHPQPRIPGRLRRGGGRSMGLGELQQFPRTASPPDRSTCWRRG